MMGIEQKILEKLERSALGEEIFAKQQLSELQSENARLQKIVAELLMQNQQLRQRAGYQP